ncbi:hypothetical protein A0256_10845 [Mucilaginibacter sp. PAMC 26640]|nr:hypothetical protein A0256_10845 [Mucilaginibacter sp. PAMC 26640]
MGEQFSLAFDHTALEQLLIDQLTIADFLEQLFGDKGSPNYRDMCEHLVAYHNKDGGSPEVLDFDLTEPVFHTDTLSGHFKCKFGIHFFYTCSDVHNNAKDTIRWDFKIDQATHIINFTGEQPWVRDAD